MKWLEENSKWIALVGILYTATLFFAQDWAPLMEKLLR